MAKNGTVQKRAKEEKAEEEQTTCKRERGKLKVDVDQILEAFNVQAFTENIFYLRHNSQKQN